MIILRQKQFGLLGNLFKPKKASNPLPKPVILSQEEIDKTASELPKEYTKLFKLYKDTIMPDEREYCGFSVLDIRSIAEYCKDYQTRRAEVIIFLNGDQGIDYDLDNKTWISGDNYKMNWPQVKKYLLECCEDDLEMFKENLYGDFSEDDIRYIKNIIAKLRTL